MWRFSLYILLAAAFVIVCMAAHGGESVMPDTREVIAIGIGTDIDIAREDAISNASRQVSNINVESGRTIQRGFEGEGDARTSRTRIEARTSTSSAGQVISHEVQDVKRVADGNWEVTIKAVIRTPEALKEIVESTIRRGIQVYRKGLFAESIAIFEEARKIPGYDENEYILKSIEQARRMEQNQTLFRTLMNEAIGKFNARDHEGAERIFRQVFQIEGYGNSKVVKQWHDRTRSILQKNQYARISLEEGRRYYQEGDYSAAIEALEKVPDNPEARMLLERAEDELQEIEQAQEQYDDIISKITTAFKDGDSAFMLNYKMKHYNTAQMEALNALAIYPNNPVLLQYLHQAREKIEELEVRQKEANKNTNNLINTLLFGDNNRRRR